MFEKENRRLTEQVTQLTMKQLRQPSEIELQAENIALKDRTEILVSKIKELEKTNSRLHQEGINWGNEKARLIERIQIQERAEQNRMNQSQSMESENARLKHKVVKVEKEKFALTETMRKFERALDQIRPKSKASSPV